ncbi:MAG: right-handed parallel beta-helix repeat-containing protein, partial [Planctomycetota bacterium]
MNTKILILILCVLCVSAVSLPVWAFDSGTPTVVETAAYQSAQTGGWNDPATWSPAGIPAAGDMATVLAGHTVTLTSTGVCGFLSIAGTGTLELNAASGPVTLTVGTGISNNGTINYNNASANTATITSTATATYNGALPTWNDWPKCQFGGFTVGYFNIAGFSPVVTLVGSITATAGVKIDSGTTLRQLNGTELKCSGGDFWINGYFDMEALTENTYLTMDGGSDITPFFGPYRIYVSAGGYISATGSSDTVRCVIQKSTSITVANRSSMIFLNGTIGSDGASGLFSWCDITKLNSTIATSYNGVPPTGTSYWVATVMAYGIDGRNDDGRQTKGLTMDNCKVAYGYTGIYLCECTGCKVTNTEVRLATNGMSCYKSAGQPNFILQNLKLYQNNNHGLGLAFRPDPAYPVVGLEAWSNGIAGVAAIGNANTITDNGYCIRDSTFGQYGMNGGASYGDVSCGYQNTSGNVHAKLVLYNCKLLSSSESVESNSNSSSSDGVISWYYGATTHPQNNNSGPTYNAIISFRHDGVDGLIRCWGDIRAWRYVEFQKLRYDKQIYELLNLPSGYLTASSPASGDVNTQKIIEMGRCYSYSVTNKYMTRIRFGNLVAPYSPVVTDVNEMTANSYVEWVGTANFPVIVRGMYQHNTQTSQTMYEFYTGGGGVGVAFRAYFGAKYCVFQDICQGLWIDQYTRISPTSTAVPTDSGLDYCYFKNNWGTAAATNNRHLTISTEAAAPVIWKNITATGCAFDTSTQSNIVVNVNNQITFTNWTNPRAYLGTIAQRQSNTWYGAGTPYFDERDGSTSPNPGVEWYTDFSAGTRKFQSKGSGNFNSSGAGGMWQWQTAAGANWGDAGRAPTSGDVVAILAGHTCTMSTGDWACQSIDIAATGKLEFNMTGGNVTLTLDEGGVINNLGSSASYGITFAGVNATYNKVTIKVKNPGSKEKPTPWVYNNGGFITWPATSPGLILELGDGDWRQTITLNPAQAITMSFISNMTTRTVTLGLSGQDWPTGYALLQFKPPASPAFKKTWIIQEGEVTVGTATNDEKLDGILDIGENTETKISDYSASGCGILVNSRGAMTATGKSLVTRDCIITSNSSYNGYIRTAATNASLQLKWCTISRMGTSTYQGIHIASLNGINTTTRSGVLIDSCTISEGYAGIYLSSVAYNNQSINSKGMGFINNTITNCTYGIKLEASNTYNYFSGNDISNCNYGIYWNGTNNSNNTFVNNTIHDNKWAAQFFVTSGNGNVGAVSGYMPTGSNVFMQECYYNNGITWRMEGQAGGGVCFWTGASNNYHVFDNCIFGKDRSSNVKPNIPSDIYCAFPNDQLWAIQFRNCVFASAKEVWWETIYNRPIGGTGGNYQGLFSYCHNKVPGVTKMWGILGVAGSNTHHFNWNNTSGVSGVGSYTAPGSLVDVLTDTATAKQLIICGIPTASMVGNPDRQGIWVQTLGSGELNMFSGNNATRPTIVTTDGTLTSDNWLGIRVEQNFKASYVNFVGLSCSFPLPSTPLIAYGGLWFNTSTARLYGNGATDPIVNFAFSNGSPNGRYMYFNATTGIPAANRTLSGCSFDNAAGYDVSLNSATTPITFTNFINDQAGTKDELSTGSTVTWQVLSVASNGSGSWDSTTPNAPWPGGTVPAEWANVTIGAGNNVTMSGLKKLSGLTILPTGTLQIDASSPTTLQMMGGGVITNTGLIKILNSSNGISFTSSNNNFFIIDGAGSIDLNGQALSVGLMDCRQPLTIDKAGGATTSTLTIINDIITRGVTIGEYGEVLHQTSGKFWLAQGDIIVGVSNPALGGGNLRLAPGVSLKLSNTTAGQYGITVESTGYLEALGSNTYVRNCYITRLGNYNSYIYLKSGANALFRFANISYLGANSSNKYGIYAQNINGGTALEGLRIDSCSISNNYRGVVLDGCTNNTATKGITNTIISNCSDIGLVVLGNSGNNNIDADTLANNSVAGLMLGGGTRTSGQTFNNLNISNNPMGIKIYSDSGVQSDLIINSQISGSSTADIFFQPGLSGREGLVLFNTTLGSVIKQSLTDMPGNNITSRRHGGAYGVTAFWGDIEITGLKQFTYAGESYTGDGDTSTRKYIRLGAAHPNFNGGRSRIKIASGNTLETIGTADNLTTFERLSPSDPSWTLTIDGGAISSTYTSFNNLDTDGVNLGGTGILTRLDNCSFNNVAANGTHIKMSNGADKTLTGCSFDNSFGSGSAVSVNSNGITPTILRMAGNYITTGFSAGTADNEQNGSIVLWQAVISLTNSSSIDATSGDFYHGDQNKPIMKLKLEPVTPVGSMHPEKLLKKIKVWLGGQYFKDSDILAVKIFKDVDLDGNFSLITDTFISSGTDTLVSGISNITLTPAQALTGTFFVVVDFSDTATLNAKIQGQIKSADYFTMESPHQMNAFSSTPSSAQRTIKPAAVRADVHIKRPADTSYIGENVYNITGAQQEVDINTGDGVTVTYNIRIQNDSPSGTDWFMIQGTAGETGWVVSYYDETNGQEITEEITNPSGFWRCPPTGLFSPAETRSIRVEVTPSGRPIDTFKEITVTAISAANPADNVSDMVKAVTYFRPYMSDAQVKAADGSYAGDSTYDPPTTQILSGDVGINYTVTYYVKIENDGASTGNFMVTGSAVPAGWTVSYYNNDTGTDITGNMVGAGWAVNSLLSGSYKTIRIAAKPGQDRLGGEQVTLSTRVRCLQDAAKVDQVKIQLTVVGGLQPDLMAKKYSDTDAAYVSNDAPYANDAATNQTTTTSIKEGESCMTYYIRLQNDGSYTDTFSVTGTGSGAGTPGSNWVITYYDGVTNITSQVTGTGWQSPVLTPSAYCLLSLVIGQTSGNVGDYKDAFVQARSLSQPAKIDAVKTMTYIASIYVSDGLISNNGSAWAGNNVREDIAGEAQKAEQTVAPNTIATYYIKMENDAVGADDSYTVTGYCTGDGWTVTYYDAAVGGADITSQITDIGAGWSTGSLDSAGSKTILLNISYNPALVNASAITSTYVFINSQSSILKKDSVKAVTTAYSYQPDIQVKLESNPSGYTGDGIYDKNPATQNTGPDWIDNNYTITYYYKIENDGTADALSGYRITATAAPADWTVRYFHDVNQNSPAITSDDIEIITGITTTGWSTGAIAKNGSKTIYARITPSSSAAGDSQQIIAVHGVYPTYWSQFDAAQATIKVNPLYTVNAMIRKEGGQYWGDGVYPPIQSNPSTVDQSIYRSGTVTYYVSVSNTGNVDTTYVITGTPGGPANGGNWSVKYFYLANEITTDVTTGGWKSDSSPVPFPSIPGGGYIEIKVKVVPDDYVQGNTNYSVEIHAMHVTPYAYDAVAATTTVTKAYQPDNLVSVNDESNYIGDGTYNSTGVGQTKTKSINRNQTAVYYVKLMNDGNFNDVFTVTGSAAPSGWAVSYYVYEGTSWVDRTTNILGATYNTPSVTYNDVGSFTKVRAEITPGNTITANIIADICLSALSKNSPSDMRDAVLMQTTCLPDYQVDVLIKSVAAYAGDGYIGDPVNPDEIKAQSVNNNQIATYYIRIENEGNADTTFKLTATAQPDGWETKYYHNPDNSSDPNGTTPFYPGSTTFLLTTLDRVKIIRAEISPLWNHDNAVGGAMQEINIAASKSDDDAIRDSVTAQTSVYYVYQADAMVKRSTEVGDGAYTRNGAPYEPSTGSITQFKSDKADYNNPVTYYVKIQNDGNTTEDFTVSGTGSYVGGVGVLDTWGTITYYDESDVDITADVLNGTTGYDLGSLTKWTTSGNNYAVVKIVVRPYLGATGGEYREVYLNANSANGGAAKQDSIKTSTTVKSNYLADAYIMNDGDGDQTLKDDTAYLRNGAPYQDESSTNQIKSQTISNRPGIQTVTYYIMIEQDGELDDDVIKITGPAGSGGWTVTYYDVDGDVDITSAVIGSGKTFPLASGATNLVRLNVTPDLTVWGGTIFPVTITAVSANGPLDVVLARTTIAKTYQPDVLVSTDDISYTRDGSAYQSSLTTDQTQSLSINRFVVATYYIKIQNDGNTTADILVTGTAGTADFNVLSGWTVSYYTISPRTDITQDIIGSGWNGGSNYTPGQEKKIVAEVIARKYSVGSKEIIVNAKATMDNSEDAVKATTTVNPAYQADAWLNKQGGSYNDTPLTKDVYETTVSTQVKSLSIERNMPATYYITLQNDGNTAADIKITSTDGGGNWNVRFYDGASDTSAITTTGLAYNLALDSTKEIILVVTPGNNTPAADSFPVTMTITSNPAGGADQIRVNTIALPTYQPDAWIALQSNFTGAIGNGIYSPDAQPITQSAPNGATVTYYVRFQNDGNTSDTFTVSGTAGDSNWVVSYYNNLADITAQIVQGTYNTGNLNMGTTAVPDIRIEVKALAVAQGTASKDVKVKATSSNGLNSDEVTAQTTVSVTSKPDVQLALTSNFSVPIGDNKYTPPDNMADQTLSQSTTYELPVATYYVRIQNDGNYNDTYTVTSSAVPSAATWQVEFGTPINQVLVAGQALNWGTINLDKDALSSPILIKVTANYGTLANDKLTLDIAGHSSADPNKRDTVRTETTFSNYYRPDLLVMKEGDGDSDANNKNNYQPNIFDTIYYPATQTYASLIENSQTLTYYIRMENDGAQNDSFTLVGNGSINGWAVSYYKLDNTDITESVISSTFATAVLASYSGTETIKVLVKASAGLLSGENYPITITATSSQSSTVDSITIDHTVKTTYKINLAIKGDGSYIGEDVYVDVNSQTVTQTVANGAAVSYYIKITNEGNVQDSVTVSAIGSQQSNPQDWTVSYYGANSQEIESTSGYLLAPFSSTEMIVQISPSNTPGAYEIKYVDITAVSVGQPTLTDTVRASAQVSLSTKVDLAIRGDTEFIDAQDGDNQYIVLEADIADDSVQFKKHAVDMNEPTTYYIRLQNDGNYSDTFLLTGTAGSSDWTVCYYEQSGQLLTDITSQVIGLGWTSSSISAGGSTSILLTVAPSLSVASNSTYAVYGRASCVSNPAFADTVKTSTKYMALAIDCPRSNKMVAQKPVVMGESKPNVLINIINSKTGELLGQTLSDVNGKYRLKLPADIPIGTVISLKPVSSDQIEGVSISNLTVSDSPSSDDVPVISEPVTGTVVVGGRTTLKGHGKPGAVVEVQANVESKGQSTLYNFEVITATVDSSGSYELTVQLNGGVRSLSVSCNGGISDIIELLFVDPTGIVYDSVTGEPIKDATVTLEYNHPLSGWITARMGIEIGSPIWVDDDDDAGTPLVANTNPYVTGSNGRYQWNVLVGEYRLRAANANYVFPGNTDTMTALGRKVQEAGVDKDKNIARGTTTFTVAAGAWDIDIPLDATSNLVKITKKANKKEVSVGEVVTYEVKVSNESTTRLKDVYVHDITPPGLKYVKNSAVAKIGNADWSRQGGTLEPTGGATKMFSLGNLTAKGTSTDTITLRYQLVVGAGALFGEYKNIASAAYYNGREISNEAIAKVRVIPDPLFDYSTIIGKVFMDANGDGIQDEGEVGMANVKIMTEDGITIITDRDGKYHIAGIKPQTKILKIDQNSLPFNSKITTMNPAVVRFTGGASLEKINFGIRTVSTEASERRNASFTVFITVKEGIPRITVGKSEIPLSWGAGETKEMRLQNIAVTINEKSLSIDPVKGYTGEISVRLDDPAVRLWARDGFGREATVKGMVPPAKLDTMVKRSSESMEVVSELGLALSPEVMELAQGKLVKAAEFKIMTNYPNFIENWMLEILEPVEKSSLVPTLPLTGADELCADDEGGFVPEKSNADKKDKGDKKTSEGIKTVVPVGYQMFKEFKG